SIHFLASASPAHALWPRAKAVAVIAAARATAFKRKFMSVSSGASLCLQRLRGWEVKAARLGTSSALAHHEREHGHRDGEADPYRGFVFQAEPLHHLFARRHEGEVHVGRAQQPDEQPVAARGGD